MNMIKKGFSAISSGVVNTLSKLKEFHAFRSAKENTVARLNQYSPVEICRDNPYTDNLVANQSSVCDYYLSQLKKINPNLSTRNELKDEDVVFYKLLNAKRTFLEPSSLDDPEDIAAPSISGDPASDEYLDGLWTLAKRVKNFGLKAPLVSRDAKRFPDYLSVKTYLDERFALLTHQEFEIANELINLIDEQVFLTNRAGGRYIRLNLTQLLPTHLHFLLGDGQWYMRMKLYRYYRNDGFSVDETYRVDGVNEKLELYVGW